MPKYIVSLQTYANFSATVEAEGEDDAYEKAQELAMEVAERSIQARGEAGVISLSISVDDVNNPTSEDIEEI